MAKQPVTTDRFRIFAETSSEAMGPLLAQLTRMGLENIGYELITDVRRFDQNAERKTHNTSHAEFALAWIADHPTFKAADLAHHFRDDDRPTSSTYSTLRDLVSSNAIVKLGPGNYQRADVKAIAAPTPPPRTRRGGQHPRHEVTNDTLILKAMKTRKRITVQGMGEVLEAEGRSPKSASPIIARFAAAGLLVMRNPGEYDVVKDKGLLAKVSHATPSKMKQTNGTGAAAHG